MTNDIIEDVNDFLIHSIAGRLIRQENNAYSDKHSRNNLGFKFCSIPNIGIPSQNCNNISVS